MSKELELVAAVKYVKVADAGKVMMFLHANPGLDVNKKHAEEVGQHLLTVAIVAVFISQHQDNTGVRNLRTNRN